MPSARLILLDALWKGSLDTSLRAPGQTLLNHGAVTTLRSTPTTQITGFWPSRARMHELPGKGSWISSKDGP